MSEQQAPPERGPKQEEPIESTAEEIPAGGDESPPAESTALVHAPEGGGAIIRADEPADVIAKATKIADALKDLIEAQNLAVNVGGRRKHVEVGGWQALGSMLGALGGQPLHAETLWTRPVAGDDGRPRVTTYHVHEVRKKWGGPRGQRQVVETTEVDYDADGLDWEARVEIRTPEGVVVGSADAMCSRAESTWMNRPDPAVRSMAETRAESRAYRRAVGWIVNIAGYNPTPAEEMPARSDEADRADAPAPAPVASKELRAAAAQAMRQLLGQAGADEAWAKVKADITGEGLPAILGRAIVHIANVSKAAGERAAEPPETGFVEHKSEGEKPADSSSGPAGPAPGTVDPTEANIKEVCTCKGETDDRCPIQGHGIPF